MSMNCPQCGQPLREGALFCTKCGARTVGGGDSLAESVPTAERVGGKTNPHVVEGEALVGRVLDGKYEILSPLGEGGMGAVYRARRVHIGDEVAVKVLHPPYVNDETLLERFRREARAAAQLHHPHIVTIHDYGEAGGTPGIAKLRDMASDSTLTQAGAVVGTPYYMSPEQCRGESLDARADVYSLGALLYEMLAGAPPFVAPSVTGVIAKHLTEAPPRIPDSLNVPEALQHAIMRSLSKDPERRQKDASEFAREIQSAAASRSGEESRP